MSIEPNADDVMSQSNGIRHPILRALMRKDTLAGLMFIAVAAAALWISRDYHLGTLRRMGAGYMPQMLSWALMGLGAIILVQGLLVRGEPSHDDADEALLDQPERQNFWSILFVAASLVAFALTIERLGLVIAILLLVAIASFAYRGLKWWETALTAFAMVALSWAVFVMGLGISVRVWPEFF